MSDGLPTGELRLAPAWAPPARFWLAWPRGSGDDGVDDAARGDCVALADLLSLHAPVTLVADPEDVAACSLRTPPSIATLAAVRDILLPMAGQAPLFLIDRTLHRAAAFDPGGPLAAALLEAAASPILPAPHGLAAGMIDSDGEGSAVGAAADTVWSGVAAALERWAGIERIIRVDDGGTGRVAAEVRFLAPGTVAIAAGDANRAALAAAIDARGRRLRLVELPRPRKRPGSYTDVIIAGRLVVVPEFGDGRDGEALDRLAAALPGRIVEPFPATLLAPPGMGLGAVVAVMPA